MSVAMFGVVAGLLCIILPVSGNDFTITCRPSFMNNFKYTVPCTVNGSRVNTERCSSIGEVQFLLLKREGGSEILGRSPYPACKKEWDTTYSPTRCASRDPRTSVATYELRYFARYSWDAMSLKCWSDCVERNPNSSDQLRANYTSCANLAFTET